MNNLEFVGRINSKKLTSLAEDFKKEQAEFLNDEAKRRAGRAILKPVFEMTYERFPDSE